MSVRKVEPARLITLDGIPGSGKSTILRELEKYLKNKGLNVICLQEPVDEWMKMVNTKGETLFELYYKDQKRYALAFQLQVLHTRFELFEKTIRENEGAFIITERDIVSDYKIFTQMLYDNGMFEEIEYKLYQQLFESYNSRLEKMCKINFRILLETPVEECFERMKKRGRKEEKDVSFEYLNKVMEYHIKLKNDYNYGLCLFNSNSSDVIELTEWIEYFVFKMFPQICDHHYKYGQTK